MSSIKLSSVLLVLLLLAIALKFSFAEPQATDGNADVQENDVVADNDDEIQDNYSSSLRRFLGLKKQDEGKKRGHQMEYGKPNSKGGLAKDVKKRRGHQMEYRKPNYKGGLAKDVKKGRGDQRDYRKPAKGRLTCDNFPRICRLKGSPGHDCCRKKCVNVMLDRLNCGMCGNKCKYGQICCRGNCVNPLFDKRHCGGCNNRCKKGDFCAYGMCNYA